MSLTSAPVVPCSCAEGWKPEGWAYCSDCYEGQIERLRRRVTVLEMVISEELDPYDCCDSANEMIVQEIRDRGYVRTPAAPSDQRGAENGN